MELSELNMAEDRVQFDISPVKIGDFIERLDKREYLYSLLVQKKITFTSAKTMPFTDMASETLDKIGDAKMLEVISRDMPAFMLSDFVLHGIDNVKSVEIFIGDKSVITEVVGDSDTTLALDIFSNKCGIIIGSIANANIRMLITATDETKPSSVVINATETYVLMSKIVDDEYTHINTLHLIPLLYVWGDFTFLYTNTQITVYDELVNLTTWKKHVQVNEYPHNTVNDEYKSVEMNITNPKSVFNELPGFDAEITNTKINELETSGIYRTPIYAKCVEEAEQYLTDNSDVKTFEIKDLAFITKEQHEQNNEHNNKKTVKLYTSMHSLFGDETHNVLEELADMNIMDTTAAATAAATATANDAIHAAVESEQAAVESKQAESDTATAAVTTETNDAANNTADADTQ